MHPPATFPRDRGGLVACVCHAHVALFDLVVQGLATAEMAERLGIRPHTVQDHLEAIFAKVGVRSWRELTSRLLAALQS